MSSTPITAIRRERETPGHPYFQRVSFCARLESRMAPGLVPGAHAVIELN
jgi:hypothetical protein